jgi:hypothetical protein
MALDYNKFQPGKKLPVDTFWMVEQVPGYSEKRDMTADLQSRGFWPSTNRPYFARTREMAVRSGGPPASVICVPHFI